MASSATKSGSVAAVEAIALPPQTILESFECCQVARILPSSSGLGLKKWVVS